MDGTEIRRAIIRAAIEKGIAEIRSDPRRGARKLVDLGTHFSRGRFQKRIFRQMQEELVDPESAYYALVTDLAAHARPACIERFGLNVGFNSWTHGAALIRENEEKKGYNIPWCLVLDQTRDVAYDADDLIGQGERLGIYSYQVFAGELQQTEALCAVYYRHRNSAFFLFLPDGRLPRVNVETLDNALFLLPAGAPETEKSAARLREAGCLYGLWEKYETPERILSGAAEEEAVRLHAPLLLAVAAPGAPDEARRAVKECTEQARLSGKKPVLTAEFYSILEEIDRVISVEPCMLGIAPDGAIFTAKGRNDKIDIRRIALDDVLLCTMPRVTYIQKDPAAFSGEKE